MKLPFPAFLPIALSLVSLPAFGRDLLPFNKAEFEQAQKGGKTILVDFHAPWCPTCRAQEPVVKLLLDGKGYSNVVAFKADFDSSGPLKKEWKVTSQSTLVVFKGNVEKARATGVTSTSDISALLKQGL